MGELSPSATIIADAAAVTTVRDALGRVLTVRRPGALDRLRLFKALGAGLCSNRLYLGYAMLAVCVVAIDDVPVPQPGNEALMEGLIGRLGDAGMVAVGQALQALGTAVHAVTGGVAGGVADAGPGNRVARTG